MSWTYDPTDLDTSTVSGRLNVVRLLVGDTDTNDQLLQDEEITFSLDQTSDNVYLAASYSANAVASRFARKVDTKLGGALSADYGGLSEKYRSLSVQLKQDALKLSGRAFGVFAGGISKTNIETARADTDRVKPSFRRDRFKVPEGYHGEYD